MNVCEARWVRFAKTVSEADLFGHEVVVNVCQARWVRFAKTASFDLLRGGHGFFDLVSWCDSFVRRRPTDLVDQRTCENAP